MSVSVVVTTASMGGLDMLFNSVLASANRTGIACEIILADEWYEERRRFISLKWWPDFKHVPVTHKGNYIDHSAGWNSGLRVAEGELVCFLNDYFWVYPDYIADHWRIYKDYPGYSMLGYCDRYPWPACKPSTRTEDVWWTAFNEEFTPAVAEKYFAETKPYYRERYGGATGEIPGNLWYASLNNSIPMAVLKALNGWNEALDSGYGVNDVELGVRANMFGWKFMLKPTVNRKIGGRAIARPVKSMNKPELRTPEENYRLFVKRIEAISSGREPLATPPEYGCWQ